MRTVFMGSPAFAVPSLMALAARSQLVAVVCQPDRPAGRGQKVTPPEVKQAALRLGVPVLQPVALRPEKSSFVDELRLLAPDLVVVVAYGRILPPAVLAVPGRGCWNVHGSLLPRYRGAAPIQWALIRGEIQTGVTLMQMDAGLDTGPMLRTQSLTIEAHDTAGSLHEKLSQVGAQLLGQAIVDAAAGQWPTPVPQQACLATLAPLLDKEHGCADFTRDAHLVCGQLRGVDPWPGGYTMLPPGIVGETACPLKLFSPRLSCGQGRPGEILGVDRQGLHVACSTSAIVIGELQLPGRKRMSAQALCAGVSLPLGTVLGDGKPNPRLC